MSLGVVRVVKGGTTPTGYGIVLINGKLMGATSPCCDDLMVNKNDGKGHCAICGTTYPPYIGTDGFLLNTVFNVAENFTDKGWLPWMAGVTGLPQEWFKMEQNNG